jgi:hypothetical protein
MFESFFLSILSRELRDIQRGAEIILLCINSTHYLLSVLFNILISSEHKHKYHYWIIP